MDSEESVGESASSPVDLQELSTRLLAEYADRLSARDVLAVIVEARSAYNYLRMDADQDLESLIRRELAVFIDARHHGGVPEPRDPMTHGNL